jgi:peptidoglycan/xylan/chitin deacetylase (PgdA/CDA1 family)
VILFYHRIAAHCPDPHLLCVTPEHLAEHLEIIRNHYQMISLRALREALFSRRLPHRAVVVTFDDGYADNAWHAVPLLRRHGLPATIFVTSGYVGSQSEMISDTLERILLRRETLPSGLTLDIGAASHHWDLGKHPSQSVPWNVTVKDYPSERHRCYHELDNLLRPMSEPQRQEALSQIAQRTGCVDQGRPEYRTMNASEIQSLAKEGQIEIGAHSVSHLMLAKQPIDIQQREIRDCKHQLEQIAGIPVTSFAYPYGGPEAVNLETKKLARQAGFELACDAIPGRIDLNADLFALPRCVVRDWGGDEFHRHLRNAFLT